MVEQNPNINITVKSCDFLYSRTKFEPADIPEICMIGRSNAGKSSLINMLVGQKNLARSSSTPGRTRLINYFELVLKGTVLSDGTIDVRLDASDVSSDNIFDANINNHVDANIDVNLDIECSSSDVIENIVSKNVSKGDMFERRIMLVDLPGFGYSKASKIMHEIWDKMLDDYFSHSEMLAMCYMLVDSRHPPMQNDINAVQYLYKKNLSFTILGAKCDKLSKSQIGQSISQIATGLKVGRDNILMTSSETGMGKGQLLEQIWSLAKQDVRCKM